MSMTEEIVKLEDEIDEWRKIAQRRADKLAGLRELFEDFEEANQKLEALSTMLGVTNDGRFVLGGLMPSGKVVSQGSDEECPWMVEAGAAVILITRLKQEFDKIHPKEIPASESSK